MKKMVLGIDVGGTNIKLGLVDPCGKVISRTNLATKSFARSKTYLVNAILRCSQEIFDENRLKKKDIAGIGIGLPGLIDIKKGIVHHLVNINGWKNVALQSIFENRFRLPVLIDNDVNMITLGEWKFGAGRGFKNLVCLTLGTGVGGGLVIDGKFYRGEGFTAGEIGHIPLNENGCRCNCGGRACLERCIGNQHLLAAARKIFGKDITLEKVSCLAARADKQALFFWRDVAVHLGNALAGVVNLLNPRCIIIGGGVANAYPYLQHTIEQTIKARSLRIPSGMVKIVRAKLGDDAGIIGARVLVGGTGY